MCFLLLQMAFGISGVSWLCAYIQESHMAVVHQEGRIKLLQQLGVPGGEILWAHLAGAFITEPVPTPAVQCQQWESVVYVWPKLCPYSVPWCECFLCPAMLMLKFDCHWDTISRTWERHLGSKALLSPTGWCLCHESTLIIMGAPGERVSVDSFPHAHESARS